MQWLQKPMITNSLYFVIGTESFFISEIKQRFITKFLKDSSSSDFDHDQLSANDNSMLALLSKLDTLPAIASKRLIFCYDCSKFSAEDWLALNSSFSQNMSHVCLVCFFDKKDARKKHFKQLQYTELQALQLKSWDLDPWLKYLSHKHQLQFSFSSKQLFKELAGNKLADIQIELKKLKLYIGSGKTKVTDQDVLACSSRLKIESIFELTEAIGFKNAPVALKCLTNLLLDSENEIGIMLMLARHIRILSAIKDISDDKLSPAQMAQKAGIAPYFLNKYIKQSQIWSKKQIHQSIEILYETDKALKKAPLSSKLCLENFILKTCF